MEPYKFTAWRGAEGSAVAQGANQSAGLDLGVEKFRAIPKEFQAQKCLNLVAPGPATNRFLLANKIGDPNTIPLPILHF